MINIYLITKSNILDYLYEQHQDYHCLHYLAEDISLMQIYKEYFSTNLLTSKKLLIVENPLYLINKTNQLKKKELEIFEQLITTETTNKLIFLIKKPLNTKITYIKQNLEHLNYHKNLEQEQQQHFLQVNKINISAINLEFLQENIQQNYDYLQELLKLKLYKDNQEITNEDIVANVKLKVEVDIFKLVESIIKHNKLEFTNIYTKLVAEESITVEAILAIMYSQLKFFLSVKTMRELKFTDTKIIQDLQCSPYRLKFSNTLVNSITQNEFITLHDKVALYDYLIKSGQTKEKNVLLNFFI
ncbi:MAG: DNA polymerase III subunit delta [Mycoplasmatales bacterium]